MQTNVQASKHRLDQNASGRRARPVEFWRHREVRRFDEPTISAGSLVWWKSGLYRVEQVEFQAEGWVAVIVRPGDFATSGAKCWFAACHELQLED